MAGIVDWKLKKQALEAIFCAGADIDLARAVLEDPDPAKCDKQSSTDPHGMKGNFKNWHKNDPSGHAGRTFLQALRKHFEHLGFHPNSLHVFLKCDYAVFYDCIPLSRRKGIVVPDGHQEDRSDIQPIWIDRYSKEITPVQALQSNDKIDQKFHYLTPDAVETWRSIIDNKKYRQYEECMVALEAFCETTVWRNFWAQERGDGMVILGAGAPTKDKLLIDSAVRLTPTKKKVHYALVDYSSYMLKHSFRMIDAHVTSGPAKDQVGELIPLEWDFLDLSGAATKLRRSGKNVAWFIPGGTIGNVSEAQLFESVGKESAVDDLFVIGAETTSGQSLEQARATLTAKYKSPAVMRFVETPLRLIGHELGISSVSNAIKRVVTDVVDGIEHDHSDVPGSQTVEISLKIRNRKVVLATSTRYPERELLSFAERNNFMHVDSVKSSKNPNYKQFVFRYVGPR